MSGRDTMATALEGGRFRPPLGQGRSSSIAGIKNLKVIAARLRTAALNAQAVRAEAHVAITQAKSKLARGILGDEGFRSEVEVVYDKAAEAARELGDGAAGLADVVRKAHATYWSPESFFGRQPLSGRDGSDGKADLLALLGKLPEQTMVATVQRLIDERDLGAIGVALVAQPDLRGEVMLAMKDDLGEVAQAEAAIASSLLDAATVQAETLRVRARRLDEPRAKDLLALRHEALGDQFAHVSPDDVGAAGLPDDPSARAAQFKVRDRVDAAIAAAAAARPSEPLTGAKLMEKVVADAAEKKERE